MNKFSAIHQRIKIFINRCASMSKFTKESTLHPTIVRVKRTKGKVVQPCDYYISKECRAAGWSFGKSEWFNSDSPNDPEEYLEYLKSNDELLGNVYQLVGQTLGCWCSGNKLKSCHGTVLVDETKRFLSEYFKRFKKQNRKLTPELDDEQQGLRMEITPMEVYKFKPSKQLSNRLNSLNSLKASKASKASKADKRYRLKIVKDDTKETKTANPEKPLKRKGSSSPKSTKKVKKIRLNESQEGFVIIWNSEKEEWILPEGYELSEDMRIPEDASVKFDVDNSIVFNLKKGARLTKNGRVDYRALITKPIKLRKRTKWVPPDPDFEKNNVLHVPDELPITQSAIGNLFTGKAEKWDPFVCKVVSRLFHKKSNRYMLKLFDGTAQYKVHLGSQLFELVKQKFIDTDDMIQVVDYASTLISSRKRVVFLYNIKKIIVGHPVNLEKI